MGCNVGKAKGAPRKDGLLTVAQERPRPVLEDEPRGPDMCGLAKDEPRGPDLCVLAKELGNSRPLLEEAPLPPQASSLHVGTDRASREEEFGGCCRPLLEEAAPRPPPPAPGAGAEGAGRREEQEPPPPSGRVEEPARAEAPSPGEAPAAGSGSGARRRRSPPCLSCCGLGGWLTRPRQSDACRRSTRGAAQQDGGEALFEAADRELRERLGGASLCCLRGQPGLDAEGLARAAVAAEVLRRYPQVGVKVLGHTNPPSFSMTADDLALLALARARAVKRALQDAGCMNPVAAIGAGYSEGKGACCELLVCAAGEVGMTEAMARKDSRRLERQRSQAMVPVTFDCGGSRRAKVAFTRRPLGITFGGGPPMAVTSVQAKGQAEALGVQVGWTFQAVDGVDVSSMEPEEAAALIARGARVLPRASPPRR